ncbi:MAG: hypothetical protein WBM41_19015 [Arenicellales bacterium]
MTQPLINKIRPEKFYLSWDSAWSWYPVRVHLKGVFANGQSYSQQWQFSATSVSGSVALIPLIFKRVWISNVDGTDIDYRQRPRPNVDKDVSHITPYFPDITGREKSAAITAPKKKKRPWYVNIDEIRVSGSHSLWIYNLRGNLDGEIGADLKVRSQGGPLSLDIHSLDLNLGTLYLNGDHEVFRKGELKGSMGFEEFVPRENRGVRMLNFLKLDAEVNLDVNSLAYINLFTLGFEGLQVQGKGHVGGRLLIDQGEVLEGTDLSADADDLQVDIASLNIFGAGAVNLKRAPDTENKLELEFIYQDVEVEHEDDDSPLLTGQGLELSVSSDSLLLPKEGEFDQSRTIAFSIDGLTVPDLSLFQRFLPEKWPFRLYGGQGQLQGSASMSSTSIAVDLSISSDKSDMGIRQYRFNTNLDAALKIDNPAILSNNTRVTGTYIKLTDAQLQNDNNEKSEPWEASVVIDKGELSILAGDQKTDEEHVVDLLKLLGKVKTKEILGNSQGLLGFEATISSLAWLSVLFKNNHNAKVSGNGTISGDLFLASGLLDVGTNVEVSSEALTVNILDYVSIGNGKVTLNIEEGGGGARPDWLMEILLTDANMTRSKQGTAGIQDVELSLKALVEDATFDMEANNDFTLDFKILSAKVANMAVFNGYLPPDSPLQFTSGTADLSADIALQREDADGWLKLTSRDLEANLDKQVVGGNLFVDILLVGGVPKDMMFDISGSGIRLDGLHVLGGQDDFDQKGWSAELELVRGKTTWTDPPLLDVEAELKMSDSRPIVAMFLNEKKPPKFLANMMKIEDIKGEAQIKMHNDKLIIPYAHAVSDNIDVGIKGVITATTGDGVIYARYKKLHAIVKISDGKRNVDIVRARRKYLEYQVEP